MRPTPTLVLVLAAAAAGCGTGETTHPIEETRPLSGPRTAPSSDTRARMGLADERAGGFAHAHGGMGDGHPPIGGGDPHGALAAPAPALAWDLPEGWQSLAATSLRAGNFAVAGREGLQCFITLLPGDGGGLAANLNRWRGQMGLPDLTPEEIDALPRVRALGADVPLLVAESEGPEGPSALAGVAVERAGGAVFVKMTGTTGDVRAELDRFRALCASLRDAAPAAPAAGPGGAAGGFAWTTPQGWAEKPARQMRLVTVGPAGDPRVECFVTVLAGAGGGLEANVNRWRSQLKLAPLAADAIAELPTLDVLGRKAQVVEIDGGQVGMFGLVCEMGEQSLFVKMTGPMDALRQERGSFDAFCTSLVRR